MFKQQILFMTFIILLLCILFTNIAFTQTLVYKNTESGKVNNSEIIITKTDTGYIIKETNLDNNIVYINYTDMSYYNLKWEYLDPKNGTDITAERSGNTIEIIGTHKNEKVEKQLKINELPWFQDWGSGPREFIKSGQERLIFWTIHPDRLQITKFECKKDKTEKITVNGREIESVKTKISLTGMFKLFWSGGDMWFRKSDGTCVYSKLNPDEPQDYTQLISEKK